MPRTLFYCINGILTNPGNSHNWTTRFNSWMIRHGAPTDAANRYEYKCDIFFRMVKQRKRADEIAAEVGKYRRAGLRIVLVGHSNGCALIGEVLNTCGQEIAAAHLFAPAAEDGVFADAIREGLVERIHIYGSKKDQALIWAQRFGPVSKFLPLMGRYGTLGLRGPEFARIFPERAQDHSNNTFGHGTWFCAGDIFNSTMALLKANDAADQQLSKP